MAKTNRYKVTLFDDSGATANLPEKVAMEAVKVSSKEADRQFGAGVATSIYGTDKGISIHVEYMYEAAPTAEEVLSVTKAEAMLLQAVKADSWYILGAIEARLSLLRTDIEQGRKTLENEDNGSAPYRSLRGLLSEAEQIEREYSEARDRLKAAGLKR
jgi:hypothetical protein